MAFSTVRGEISCGRGKVGSYNIDICFACGYGVGPLMGESCRTCSYCVLAQVVEILGFIPIIAVRREPSLNYSV